MLIKDRIYGVYDIVEPVILELIHSDPLLRLKNIYQSGASQYLFAWKNVTRYEHSLGVMLLLKDFGANLHEQIAGLLHDIPHTAFSHVADFVFANKQHNYHEQFHESILKNSDIPEILSKYQIPKTVAKPENYKLLELDIPEICADRIDYALRDFYTWKRDLEGIHAKLTGLTVIDNEFVFKNLYAAEAFARDYLDLDEHMWADPTEIAAYEILAQAIRHALDKKILTKEDLFTTDQGVYQILKLHGDVYIHKKLSYLTPGFRTSPANKNHYHLHVKTKTRYVDPKVLVGGKLKRLSFISAKFKNKLEAHIKQKGKGNYIFIHAS